MYRVGGSDDAQVLHNTPAWWPPNSVGEEMIRYDTTQVVVPYWGITHRDMCELLRLC